MKTRCRSLAPWMKLLVAILPWVTPSVFADSLGNSPESLFHLGNREVAAGNYTNGLSWYSKVAAPPRTSAALEYNRGVAWARLGEESRAQVHWHLAERLSPRNPFVVAALRRPNGPVGITPDDDLMQWTDRLTLREWGILALVPTWIWGGLLFVRRWNAKAAVLLRGYTLTVGILAWVAVGFLVTAVLRRSLGPDALTSNPQTPIRISPLDEARAAFELPAGAPLRTQTFREGWYLVVDPRTERSGWVRANQLTLLPIL